MWGFGDGDYGKLGLGNTAPKSTPARVDALCDVGLKKIGCGAQFSVALSWDGRVYTCGQGKLLCLLHVVFHFCWQ